MQQNDTKQGLSGRRALAAAALIRGDSHQQAADAAGVSRASISRWLQDSDFADAIQTGSSAIVGATINALAIFSLDAVHTAYAIMMDASESGYTRLMAARLLLDGINRNRDTLLAAAAENTEIVVRWEADWRGENWEEKQWGQS